jgi:hypothetical protein
VSGLEKTTEGCLEFWTKFLVLVPLNLLQTFNKRMTKQWGPSLSTIWEKKSLQTHSLLASLSVTLTSALFYVRQPIEDLTECVRLLCESHRPSPIHRHLPLRHPHGVEPRGAHHSGTGLVPQCLCWRGGLDLEAMWAGGPLQPGLVRHLLPLQRPHGTESIKKIGCCRHATKHGMLIDVDLRDFLMMSF